MKLIIIKAWLEKEHIEHGNLKALVCTLHHYVELCIGLVSLSRYVMPTDNSFYNCRSDVILQTIVLHTLIHVFK